MERDTLTVRQPKMYTVCGEYVVPKEQAFVWMCVWKTCAEVCLVLDSCGGPGCSPLSPGLISHKG